MQILPPSRKIIQRNKFELNRDNSIIDSESDASDFFENHEEAKYCTPPSTHHVVQFRAPNSADTNTVASKQFSKDARRAVKKRREVQRGMTKGNTSIISSRKNKSKKVCELKSGSLARGRSRERRGSMKKFIRRSLSLRKPSSGGSCFGCNVDSSSVGSSSSKSKSRKFFSRLKSLRRSKSRDSVGSTSSWGSQKWRKWRKSKPNRTPKKERRLIAKQVSPTDVADFVEFRPQERNKLERTCWLCASMEPVVLCQDFFCANDVEEELSGKLQGTENNRPQGILRNRSTKNSVRFEEGTDDDDNDSYDFR